MICSINGARLKQIREANGYTQEDIATETGATVYDVQGWEEGWALSNPSSGEISTLAELFGMTEENLREEIDADEDFDSDCNDKSWGELLEDVIQAGKVANERLLIEYNRQELEARAIKTQINKNRRAAWRKKHRFGIFVVTILLIVLVLSAVGYYEYQKLQTIGYFDYELEGLAYSEVAEKLNECGFSCVYTKEISDLPLSREDEANLVTEVRLLFDKSFEEGTKFPNNLPIIIVYHTIKLRSVPIASKEAKGLNYSDVISKFESAGYTNIITKIEYDIVTGWIINDGEVKSVTINGDEDFDTYDEYRPDAEVVITYHTYKKNDPNK